MSAENNRRSYETVGRKAAEAISEFVAISGYRLATNPHVAPDDDEMKSYHRMVKALEALAR
jgi:hypothetical protein